MDDSFSVRVKLETATKAVKKRSETDCIMRTY